MVRSGKNSKKLAKEDNKSIAESKSIICPYCKSKHTGKTGLAHGVGAGLKLPEAISKQYECLDCKKLFDYPRMYKIE